MEIVELYFHLGHTSTQKKWRHSYAEIVCSFKIPLIFQYLHIFPVDAYFSGHIPPLKKVEAFLYGKCGGIFSVRPYLHFKNVEAFLYGNCNVALKFH